MCLGQTGILGWGEEELDGSGSRIRICRKSRYFRGDKLTGGHPKGYDDLHCVGEEELAAWVDLDVVQGVELTPKEVVE